jgi:hypothetical protein
MPWSDVESIDVRGPDEPEYLSGSRPGVPLGGWPGLVALLVYLYLHSKDRLPKTVKFSWLAFRLMDKTVSIFEVYGALHDRLETFLEAHSG